MRLARLVSIILLLLQHDKISATKLAERFEVTPRTIFRDIETISNAGIPIITYAGVKGGISISEQFKLDNGLFTTGDIAGLLYTLGVQAGDEADIVGTIAQMKNLPPKAS